MNLFDNVAFWGRRYEPQKAPRSGSRKFSLADVLEMFDRRAILELTPYVAGRPTRTVRPDGEKKLKVSLLDDGFSEVRSDREDWYEVLQTAPSGDLSKAKIVVRSPDDSVIGEIRLLISQRTYEHYFLEDPLFLALRERDQ